MQQQSLIIPFPHSLESPVESGEKDNNLDVPEMSSGVEFVDDTSVCDRTSTVSAFVYGNNPSWDQIDVLDRVGFVTAHDGLLSIEACTSSNKSSDELVDNLDEELTLALPAKKNCTFDH